MNRVIKLLILSDIFFVTGFGLIDPILAIFINENIEGGSIFAAGLASTLFLVTKSFVQLPFSKYVDRHENKAQWLIISSCLIAVVPFLYMFAHHIYTIYFAQVIHGIASGLAYSTWLGLWSLNLDRRRESYEWSLYSTLSGIGAAITGAIGAAVAAVIGFSFTFLLVGVMSILGCLVLVGLEADYLHRIRIPFLRPRPS